MKLRTLYFHSNNLLGPLYQDKKMLLNPLKLRRPQWLQMEQTLQLQKKKNNALLKFKLV